jgi:hypothetical protein
MSPTLEPVFDQISTEPYHSSPAWTEVTESDAEDWLQEAITKTVALQRLPQDWDSYGSGPTSLNAVRVAVRLLYMGWRYSSVDRLPEILPVSGGGLQLIWHSDDRQVEMDVDHAGKVTVLKLEDDDPVGDDEPLAMVREEVEAVLNWL